MTLNLKYFLHLITMAMIWLKMVNSVNKIDNIFNSTHIKGLFFRKVPYVIKKKKKTNTHQRSQNVILLQGGALCLRHVCVSFKICSMNYNVKRRSTLHP